MRRGWITGRRQDASLRCAVPGARRRWWRSCSSRSPGAPQARSAGNAGTHTLVRHPSSPPTVASTLRPVPWHRWSDAQQRGLSMERSQCETVCASTPAALQSVPVPSSALLVAYLSPADNVSRPLPYRLRRLNQPIMSPPNWFSTPRSTLWTSIGAHASCSPARSSTGILF